MGSSYLTWMADAFEQGGLAVVRYQGWTTRARSSGGFEPGRPLCVMWHHTASQTSPDNDSYYMCHSSGDRPIANVLVARDGTVWCLAAGATNTNGKGKSLAFSRGTVPADNMNTHAFGMELANSGVGEAYPQVQVDAAFKVSNIINSRMGNKPTDVSTHQFYAPDRKIDPATAAAVQGPWKPRSCTSSGTWNVDDLRNECSKRGGGSTPKPPLKDDDIMLRAAKNRDTGSTYVLGDGKTAQTMDGLDSTEVALRVAGGVVDVATKKIVYSWSNVGAIAGADVKKYVGSY